MRYVLQELIQFQSTLLQEERLVRCTQCTQHGNFNPRSYKRSDGGASVAGQMAVISIHAPTRGATVLNEQGYALFFISIHAPTRGATTERGRL